MTSDDPRLAILLLDYEMARDDERTLVAAQATLIGVAIALIALLAGALTQVCDFAMRSGDCVVIPDLVLGAAPLLPLGTISFAQMVGVIATLRSYYMRGLEAELGAYINKPIVALGDIAPPSFTGLSVELASLRRGRLGYRILANTILLSILLVFGGITLYIFVKVDNRLVEVAMLVVYGTITIALLAETAAATTGGRRLFMSTARRFLEGDGYSGLPKVTRGVRRDIIAGSGQDSVSDPGNNSSALNQRKSKHEGERSLLSYLLLPRPEDLIKWTIAPIVFAITALSTGNWTGWPQFLVLWLILEYLIYESRYQWNDVRGLDEDSNHAEHRSRARLPLGVNLAQQRHNIIVSIVAGLIRLSLAILIGWAFHLTVEVLILMALVYGIAILYEVLRARAKTDNPLTLTFNTVAIWLWVGLGYAVRAGLAFSLAGLPLFTRASIVGIVYFIVFGIMFVLLTWVLDATSYCRLDSAGTWYWLPALKRKPHLAALLHYFGVVPKPAEGADAGSLPKEPVDRKNPAYCGNKKVLKKSKKSLVREAFSAPWNWAMLASMGIGAALGIDLAVPREGSPLLYVIAVAISLTGSVLLAISGQIKHDMLILIAFAVILGLLGISAASEASLLAVVPWLATGLMYLNFRYSSYRDLKDFLPGIVKSARIIPGELLRILVGRATWRDKFEPKSSSPAE